MQLFWQKAEESPLSVREVHKIVYLSGNQVAYTTVMTVMSRLADKGMLKRKLIGRGYVYTAKLDSKHAVKQATQDFMHTLQGQFGDAALVHFAESLPELDPKLARQLRKAFDQLYD